MFTHTYAAVLGKQSAASPIFPPGDPITIATIAVLSAIIVVFVLLAVILFGVLLMVLLQKKGKVSLRAQRASQLTGSCEMLLCDDVDQGHMGDKKLQTTSVDGQADSISYSP